nr:oxygenase MpaB family protein [Aquiflexum gelatinilyticum]
MLGFYSLPYCYAFADGAQVLVRSKRITDEVGMRLSETALFLLDCFVPGTFLEESKSLLTIAKVRLIHAFSRYFVSHYAKDWNPDWGLPINQEDMIGTNLAFSLMVMRGMEKLNRFPGVETHEAVLHYWKVIGHYLGIEIAYWPETAKESFELEKLIRKRHVRPSEAGNTLIRSLLGFYEKSIPDTTLSSLSETLVAYFVGKEVADVLGIKEKAKLPKSVYALVLDFNFLKQSGGNPSYLKTRTQFLEQSKNQFGKELRLNIPVPKRP